MKNLKPYPSYKDSGVEWIGEIPEGWEVHKLKYKTIINKKKLDDDTDPNYLMNYLDISNVDSNGNIINMEELMFEDAPSRARRIPKSGDTIISTVRTYLKAIAYLKEIPDNLIVSTGFAVLEPIDTDSKFIFYATSSEIFIQNVIASSKGVAYPAINPPELGQIPIIIPPIPDQSAIAAFLDRRTARIDDLIARNRRLIDLLREKRTALINHAVTKGLDPDARMKDSGVEWIGEIPEGWGVRKLKFNCQVNPTGKRHISDPKTIVSFLPMEKVTENGDYDLESTAEYGEVSNGYTFFKDGDVLIAKITPCFENGKGALINGMIKGYGFGTTEFHVLRNTGDTQNKYLYYFTKTHLFRTIGEAYMYGAAGQKRISTEFVKEFPMVTPPLPTQSAIAAFLDHQTARIDTEIKLVEKKIELLEEYRKSLIHHVVTGKVDVRGVEA